MGLWSLQQKSRSKLRADTKGIGQASEVAALPPVRSHSPYNRASAINPRPKKKIQRGNQAITIIRAKKRVGEPAPRTIDEKAVKKSTNGSEGGLTNRQEPAELADALAGKNPQKERHQRGLIDENQRQIDYIDDDQNPKIQGGRAVGEAPHKIERRHQNDCQLDPDHEPHGMEAVRQDSRRVGRHGRGHADNGDNDPDVLQGQPQREAGAEKVLAFRCIHASRNLDPFSKYHLNSCSAENDTLPFAA